MKKVLLLLFILPHYLVAQKSAPIQTSQATPAVETLKRDLVLLNSQRKKTVHEHNVQRSQLNANYEMLQKTRSVALALSKKLDSLNAMENTSASKDRVQIKFDDALGRLDSLTGQNLAIGDRYHKKSAEIKTLDERIQKTKRQITELEEKDKKLKRRV